MLGRQCWRLLTRPNSLVARILKAKYHPNTNFSQASIGKNPSYSWRSIMAAHDLVLKGSRIRIGNGTCTLIKNDPWLPDLSNGLVSSDLDDDLSVATVKTLFVDGRRELDVDLISSTFNERDRNLILNIPLSQRNEEDVWYWLANTSGVYSVKSAYRLLLGEVSDVAGNMWRKIWKLEVPAKVRNFVWRAASNVLPTAVNLRSKHVSLNDLCLVGNFDKEIVLHLLVDCPFARTCWIKSKVGFFGIYSSFKDWLQALFRNCTNEQCWIAVMVCWKLWCNRNNLVWQGKCDTAKQIVNAAGNLLFQWQSAKSSVISNQVSSDPCVGAVAWSPPRVGWLKCNTDAAVFANEGRVGLGSVIRDESGKFVAALCCNIRGNYSPRDAEVLSIREALSWLKSMKLSKVIVETDCLQAFNALVDRKCPLNSFGSLVLDCKCIADSIGDIAFSFVRRSANSASHFVARAGNSLPGREVWRSVPPSWLISVL
ncbi:putative reverse transcriptase/RNA-dependent DNA polymerase [Citrus sinensis]|uniref:Reverse transcriptase/RNA-dependent DNA polymerase n=1 Tax=Citrus sinensis TaxID=2711 RepID=A0ACB8JNR8_CITSI|nr:putative reverse transcriptase/RNA-dependent DNA polymerase [Citrus sinensis]